MLTKIKICFGLLLVVMLGAGFGRPGYGQNLLNGGFETMLANEEAAAWRADFWNSHSKLGITTQKVHSGKYAAIIESNRENDARFIQEISVEPNTVYRLSGWAATSGVSYSKIGANLCIMGGFVYSNELQGNYDWQPLELVFRAGPRQTRVTIGLRLGFYGNTTQGTAYFDDIRLEKVTDPAVAYRDLDAGAFDYNSGVARAVTFYYPQTLTAVLLKIARFFSYPFWVTLFYLVLFYGLGTRPQEYPVLAPDKGKLGANFPLIFSCLILAALLVRLPLFSAAPFPTDMGNFKAWTLRIAETGPLFFYKSGYYCDYPPFSLYILWFLGGLVKLFKLSANEALLNAMIKIPALLCDIGTAWLMAQLLRKKSPLLSLILAGLYLLTPAVIYNSAYWGQMDTYYMFLVLGAFYLIVVKRRPEWAAVLVTASFLTKAQTITFIPLFLLYLSLNFERKRCWRTIGAALLTFVLIILPFNLHQPIGWIFDLYRKQAGLYPYATLNAANFLALLNGNNRADSIQALFGFSYATLGYFLFGVCTIWCGYYYWRRRTRGGLLVAFTMNAFAFFMFFPRMHERYLFPVFALLALVFAFYKDRRLLYIWMLLGVSNLLNMNAVVLKFQNLLTEEMFQRIIYIISIINTTLFIVTWGIFQLRLFRGKRRYQAVFGQYCDLLRQAYLDQIFRTPFRLNRRDYLTVALLVLVYSVLIFVRLGSWSTPATGVDLSTPQKEVEIVFAGPVNVKTVTWYDAEGDGKLQIAGYIAGAWQNLALLGCENYYVLKRQPLVARNVERIKITPRPGAGHLKEIAFLDADDRVIPIQTVIATDTQRQSAPARRRLFDEQAKMAQLPSCLNSTYFDEIYHGRTAYEFVTRSAVYETTHPPLGKDILAIGVALFGMNPFGMRVMHALVGISLIIALFFLGRQISATRFGAYATMMLGFFDFMPFVQSRYSSIDSTSVCLITLMLIFTFKYLRGQLQGAPAPKARRIIAAIVFFFALAASVKWTALYGFVGVVCCVAIVKIRQCLALHANTAQAVAALETRPTMKGCKGKNPPVAPAVNLAAARRDIWLRDFGGTVLRWLALFVLIAPLVYYSTYISYLRCQGVERLFSKTAVTLVLENQKGMYDYHSKLTAGHPFSSNWWSWPFNFKPLWLYTGSHLRAGHKASIVTMGNPVIWFVCLLALLLLLYQLRVERKFTLLHLALALFFALYLPWVLVKRATFIYHFFPVTPLYYIMLATVLEPLWKMGRSGRRVLYVLAALVVVVWLCYYPALSGLEISEKYLRALRLFPRDWVF
jgi:dolichyl-phosphate-mannose-protein mannosyltransferase